MGSHSHFGIPPLQQLELYHVHNMAPPHPGYLDPGFNTYPVFQPHMIYSVPTMPMLGPDRQEPMNNVPLADPNPLPLQNCTPHDLDMSFNIATWQNRKVRIFVTPKGPSVDESVFCSLESTACSVILSKNKQPRAHTIYRDRRYDIFVGM